MITIEELNQLSDHKLLEEVITESEKFIDLRIRRAILNNKFTSTYVGTEEYSNYEIVNTPLKKIVDRLNNVDLYNKWKSEIIKKYEKEGYKIEMKSVDIGFHVRNDQFHIEWGHLLKGDKE